MMLPIIQNPRPMEMQAQPASDGLQNPARSLAMLTIMLGLGLATMDSVIANVALPALSEDLKVAPSATVWIANAYQLVLVCALLPCASLGDSKGYRRVYVWGLAGFTLASLACALSRTLPTLVLARAVQGVGAAGILSVNSALVRQIWPSAKLGRGIGINAVIAAGGFALGPTVASILLTFADWKWLFVVNVPLGMLAILLAMITLPKSTPRHRPFDITSALLSTAVLASAILGIHLAADRTEATWAALLVATSGVLGLALYRRETRSAAPLLPVDLFGIALFRKSVLTSICAFCAASLALLALPFHLKGALDWPTSSIGFLITPWPLATACTAIVSGRLADRYPPGLLGALGMAMFGASLALLTAFADAGPLIVIACMAVCGGSFGLFQTPNNRALLGSAPLHRSGGASGMLGVARSLGFMLGSTSAAFLFRSGQEGLRRGLYLAIAMAGVAAVMSLSRGRAGLNDASGR